MEWAKKTGRIKGSEQQELIEFAKKILANAEENGDLIRPVGGDEVEEEPQTERPRSGGHIYTPLFPSLFSSS